MYFLWKQTPHGAVRISHDGLFTFVRWAASSFPEARLYSLALDVAEDGARLVLVFLPRRQKDTAEGPGLEGRLSSLMEPLGMRPSIIWTHPDGNIGRLARNPWTWMSLAASIALVVNAGWPAFFWTAFWGTAAWFVARGFSFLKTWIGVHRD